MEKIRKDKFVKEFEKAVKNRDKKWIKGVMIAFSFYSFLMHFRLLYQRGEKREETKKLISLIRKLKNVAKDNELI